MRAQIKNSRSFLELQGLGVFWYLTINGHLCNLYFAIVLNG